MIGWALSFWHFISNISEVANMKSSCMYKSFLDGIFPFLLFVLKRVKMESVFISNIFFFSWTFYALLTVVFLPQGHLCGSLQNPDKEGFKPTCNQLNIQSSLVQTTYHKHDFQKAESSCEGLKSKRNRLYVNGSCSWDKDYTWFNHIIFIWPFLHLRIQSDLGFSGTLAFYC